MSNPILDSRIVSDGIDFRIEILSKGWIRTKWRYLYQADCEGGSVIVSCDTLEEAVKRLDKHLKEVKAERQGYRPVEEFPFKTGDIVECVDNRGFETALTVGKQYTVTDLHLFCNIMSIPKISCVNAGHILENYFYDGSGIQITNNQGDTLGFLVHRFKKVSSFEKKKKKYNLTAMQNG